MFLLVAREESRGAGERDLGLAPGMDSGGLDPGDTPVWAVNDIVGVGGGGGD